jgi:hypothetical protein
MNPKKPKKPGKGPKNVSHACFDNSIKLMDIQWKDEIIEKHYIKELDDKWKFVELHLTPMDRVGHMETISKAQLCMKLTNDKDTAKMGVTPGKTPWHQQNDKFCLMNILCGSI